MRKFFTTLVALVLTGLTMSAQVNLENGLVAHYPFSGNANDVSKNNNGTVNGATLTADRFGNANSAYNFNGINNYISVNAANFINNNYTYVLWFKSSSEIPIGKNLALINIGESGGTQMVCVSNQYVVSSNTGVGGIGYFSSGQNKILYDNIIPQPNQWNFVAFSWSNNQLKIVVNDKVYTMANDGSLPYYSTSPKFNIGCQYNLVQYFAGQIDDIRIYNRAINDQEIQALRNENAFSISTINQTAMVGKFVEVPCNTITLNSTHNIISYQFDYNYDNTKLEYQNYNLAGTWAENASIQVNTNTTGKLSIAWARQTPMTGTGTGAILKLRFKSIDAGVTTPTITNALFNTNPVSTITNGTLTTTYKYGDIDGNDLVQAYDAALAIQYSVGLNPIPVIDPTPWENWRIKAANVDGQSGVTASDASDILKFTVGLINKFAAGKKSINNADIDIKIENGNIVFRSSGELFGLNVSVNENKSLLGTPQILNTNMLSATNISTSTYAIGLATSAAQKADEIFMKIPILGSSNSKITFDMVVNTENKSVTVDLSITSVNEINENSLSMFPNPVTNELTINNISKNATISIYDLNGKLLINKTANSTIEKIDVSNLAGGVYSVKVSDNHSTKTSKLIKQ